MSYLLDTNVLSEVRKPNADPNVSTWLKDVDGNRLYLSVLVLGEVRQGVERLRRRDVTRATEFDEWLQELQRSYVDRIVLIDAETADIWGRLNAERTLPVIDGLLAATALRHSFTVVTRNTKDFDGTGVKVLDPFSGPAPGP